MGKDTRDILELLKKELEFIEKGGYSKGSSWGPQCVFEDSPTCINYRQSARPHPCSDCALIQFVPVDRRSEKIACRHIPLDASGETLDSLYRYADQREVETAVRRWLLTTIKTLEEEQKTGNKQTALAR